MLGNPGLTLFFAFSGCWTQTRLPKHARVHFNYEQEIPIQENKRESYQWYGEEGQEWTFLSSSESIYCRKNQSGESGLNNR
jgi:hypothetical protein